MNNIIKRVWNQNKLVNIEDLTGMAFQAEDGGHTFQISGVDDTGTAVELSGTVAGVFVRPDNADIALTGSASGGVVSVTLDEDCYAVPGRFGLTIFVTSDDQKVAVYACVGTVSRTSTGGVAGDTPTDVVDLVNAISAAIADLNSAIGQIPASYANVMAAIAPTYSGSALYSVGSYAWYNGSLYRCITAVTSGEAWTAGHWVAVALGGDVSNLSKTVINGYQSLNRDDFTQGTWSNRAISTANSRICTKALYPVKKGDEIYIKTGTLQIAHGIYQDGQSSSTDYKGWHSAASGETYYAAVDGCMFFQCKKTDDTAVTPADFDAIIQIHNNAIERNASEISRMDNVVNDVLWPVINYGFEKDNYEYIYSSTARLQISKSATQLNVNGFNNSGYGVRTRVNNLIATNNGSDVAGWSSGLKLKPGHTYCAENKLISGSVSFSGSGTKPTMSVYATGTSSSAGSYIYTKTGSKRFFTAEYGKEYNLVFYVNSGTTFNNAVYDVILRDITEQLADETKAFRVHNHASYAIAQGGVVYNGYAYVYHSNSPTGITKVNLKTGEETEYAFDFSHGNDMTVYDGKLYICSMNDDGTIHIVDLATMTETGHVDFQIDGVAAPNSGIAYDAVNNRFILKLESENSFAFANTSLVYQSSVDIGLIDSATSQGIETDGYYIYWAKYSPNELEIFDYDGAFVDSVKIADNNEPEAICKDSNGAWWMITNVVSSGWYLDAVQITKNLSVKSIGSLIKTLS